MRILHFQYVEIINIKNSEKIVLYEIYLKIKFN